MKHMSVILQYKTILFLSLFTCIYINDSIAQEQKSNRQHSVAFNIGTINPDLWKLNYNYGITLGKKERVLLDLQGHLGFVDGREISVGPGFDFVFGKSESNNRFLLGGYVLMRDFIFPIQHIAYRRYFLNRKLYIDLNVAVYYFLDFALIPDIRYTLGYRIK